MQQHRFIIEEKSRVYGLTAILIDLIPTIGLSVENRGAARSKTRPIDSAEYALFHGKKEIGSYEYWLKEGVYDCTLNLNDAPREAYEQVIEVLKQRFPEIE